MLWFVRDDSLSQKLLFLKDLFPKKGEAMLTKYKKGPILSFRMGPFVS